MELAYFNGNEVVNTTFCWARKSYSSLRYNVLKGPRIGPMDALFGEKIFRIKSFLLEGN